MSADWHTMDSAPTDGRPFLVQYLPYARPVLCMRKVKFSVNVAGQVVTDDCGAWWHVIGIDDDWQDRDTTGEPSIALAPDKLNNVASWRWCEIPDAPQEVLDAIRADQAAEAPKMLQHAIRTRTT